MRYREPKASREGKEAQRRGEVMNWATVKANQMHVSTTAREAIRALYPRLTVCNIPVHLRKLAYRTAIGQLRANVKLFVTNRF